MAAKKNAPLVINHKYLIMTTTRTVICATEAEYMEVFNGCEDKTAKVLYRGSVHAVLTK